MCILIGIFSISATAQVKVIAHRGFWDTEGSAQNSISALQKAGKCVCYGSEFDVRITKDGILVINHDGSVNGIDIENANYADIWNVKLVNDENLPILEQYFAVGRQIPEMKLIVEIKSHKLKTNEDRAVDAVLEMVNRMNLQNQVEYISFSFNICERLLEKNPQAKVAYLESDRTITELKAAKISGIDYNYRVFEQNPELLDQAKEAGLSVNVWTVNDEKLLRKYAVDKRVDMITTNKPLLLKQIIKEIE